MLDQDGGPPKPARPLTPELLESYARMSGILLSEETMASILDLIAELSVATVTGASGVSVTLSRDGRVWTAAHTDETVKTVDEYQYELQEGPCVQAIRDGQSHYLKSMDDLGWPTFRLRAAEHGIGSILSYPLQVRDRPFGSINLYATSPDAFDEQAQRIGSMFAKQAAVIIANADEFVSSSERAEQLTTALETRDIIGQAKGIIMANQRCSSDQAFDILRRASQRENKKLREVAREMVERAQQHT